jgi:hypothetical protein
VAVVEIEEVAAAVEKEEDKKNYELRAKSYEP